MWPNKDDRHRRVRARLYSAPLYSRMDRNSTFKKHTVSCLHFAWTHKIWTSSILPLILRRSRCPSRVVDMVTYRGKCLICLWSPHYTCQHDKTIRPHRFPVSSQQRQLNLLRFLQLAWWQAVCLADDVRRQQSTENCSVFRTQPCFSCMH